LAHALRRKLEEQARLNFTYAGVGATAVDSGIAIPRGYVVDVTSIKLGEGPEVFERAKAALRDWQQFNLNWVEAFPSDTPMRAGETVLVVARAFGLWWTNAARIVYTIDRPDSARSYFGFAYGTLPSHVEAGEERFLIEWDQKSGSVEFEITAFSRPHHLLSRIARPYVRMMQRKFASQATAAMRRAVIG
jgi:uncharacterized protein (UPF0548 family)